MTLDTNNDTDVETPQTEAAQSAQPAASAKVRETSTIAGSVLTFELNGETESYDAHEVHNDAAHHLKMAGLRHALSTSTNRAKTWEAIKGGTYGLRQPAAPKALDAKRQAIANALVEHTKKSDAPVTPADAEAKARAMDRVAVGKEMLHPLVVKHFNKINGPTSALFG